MPDNIAEAVLDRSFNDAISLRTRQRYEGSLWEFVRDSWPWIDSSKFETCWAIEALCDHLEMVTSGDILRFLANYPPRCSKTTIASICWPAWTWARGEELELFWSGPQVRFLCGSYNERLSFMNANKMRRLIVSPFYQRFWGERFMLTWDQNTKSQFDNTKGGSRISTSVKGGLLGLGGDVIVVDDPHNTETEKAVETDTERERVKGWWKELSSTRLNNPQKTAIVVIMQRLHEEDLSGVILGSEAEDWVHMMIPMRYDERRHSVTVPLLQYKDEPLWEDPRGEQAEQQGHDGQLMWPERYGEKEVARQETIMGPYMAAGRLQQSPMSKGGNIIKSDWWKVWDNTTAQRYGLEWLPGINARKEFPHMQMVVGSVDTAFKEKEENDFNAMTVWGVFLDHAKVRRTMLMFAWAKHLGLRGPILEKRKGEAAINFKDRQKAVWGVVEHVADCCKRYKVEKLLIEDKARGYDVAQELRTSYARENWGIELVDPQQDKVSRGHTCVPIFTDGSVWAPNTQWAQMTIDQCSQVPKAAHDDIYDTVTQFLNWARREGILLLGDEADAALKDEATFRGREVSVADSYGVSG